MNEVMLTTIDNPYNPFTQFDQWYRYDEDHGYHSCSYLARIAKVSSNLSFGEVRAEIERAIDEIVEYNPLKIYKKVVA